MVSGVPVWGRDAGGEESRCSGVSVFSDREEALGPCGSARGRFLLSACRDTSVTAVLLQTSSQQLHQVKLCLPFSSRLW